MKRYISILLISFLFLLTLGISSVFAECNDVDRTKAEITQSQDVECESTEEDECARYSIKILEGDLKGKVFEIDQYSTAYGYAKYSKGDTVYVSGSCMSEDEIFWAIQGHSRERSLLFLFTTFVLVVFLISGRKGLGAVLGLLVSFLVIYFVMIPLSIDTGNILLWGFPSMFLVLTISIYLSHGFNRKSSIALLCTIIGLLIVSILSIIFISSTKLTGFGSEEVFMLLSQTNGAINIRKILFLSILISGIGVLDDVTVSQVSTVVEIVKANPKLSTYEVFRSSMNIGKDHISSMVNTLFIAYAGSSLSLIMLMNANGTTWSEILNSEFLVEEMVRAIISSLGLVLVVPITALVASLLVPRLIKEGKIS